MVVRKYLAEGSVAKVIWEENVRWKEERAQNSALRKLTLMGKSRWTRMSQALGVRGVPIKKTKFLLIWCL